MANVYYNTAYGESQPLLNVFAAPIISLRAPTTADKAQIGTLWVYTTTNTAYVLTSIVGGLANWTVGGNSGTGDFTSVVVNPGNLTVSAGNISATAGSISAGTTIAAGTSLSATTSVAAGTTVTAGTGITATTGNIVATTGNITATAGNIVATAGNFSAPAGSISVGGNVTGTQLYAAGDNGVGIGTTTSFTNVVNTTQSSGALTILATSTGSNTNTGLLKIYVGTTVAYIPYWETIT